MNIAIDATNIYSGGGQAHLVNLLKSLDGVITSDFKVHLWVGLATLKKIPHYDWLVIHSDRWCNSGLLVRMLFQQFLFKYQIVRNECRVLFCPSGIVPFNCPVPVVAMSQNLLPFEYDRSILFGRFSKMHLKMQFLRVLQIWSFSRAQGIIFLSNYARQRVINSIGSYAGEVAIIPHGVENRFFLRPRSHCKSNAKSHFQINILYVSIQLPYKHHIEVMDAISILREKGVNVKLQLIGGRVGEYAAKVHSHRLQIDPMQNFIDDLGLVDYDSLHDIYASSDIFVFASSCENLPNILIEAMASGLPIASSDKGPMPEILGDAGVYFNPESAISISEAVESLILNYHLRSDLAEKSWSRAQRYSWDSCAVDTLKFVSSFVKK